MANQNLTVDFLRILMFFFFFQFGCPGDVFVVLTDLEKLSLQRPCLLRATQIQKHFSEFHACSLPLGVEFQGLLKGIGRGARLALCEQKIAAYLVWACKLRIDGQGMFDARVRLIESLKLYQYTSRQAQEIGILRVPVQCVGADGIRRSGLACLQERLCLLKKFLLFYFL